MSISKVLCTALATVAVGTLFAADANSTLITFSSSGDKYADGSPVLDGEWYALCWSANETFGGLKADCTPVAEGDEVIRLHSLAKGGGCPLIVFVLSGDDAKDSGYYFVYMLDTRVGTDTLAAKVDGKPAAVNASSVAMTTGSTGSGVFASVDETGKTVAAADGSLIYTEPAKITAIDPNGEDDTVVITVANVHPLLKYDIKYGKTVSTITSATDEKKFSSFGGTGTVQFSVKKDDANFFQLKLAE